MKDGEKNMETIIIGAIAGAVIASVMPLQGVMPKLFQ
jgi:gas vesicle protein